MRHRDQADSTRLTRVLAGKTIIAIGEHLTPQRYAEVLSSTLGKKVTAAALSFDAFNAMRTSPNPFVAELYLNLRCVRVLACRLCSYRRRYFTDDWCVCKS